MAMFVVHPLGPCHWAAGCPGTQPRALATQCPWVSAAGKMQRAQIPTAARWGSVERFSSVAFASAGSLVLFCISGEMFFLLGTM